MNGLAWATNSSPAAPNRLLAMMNKAKRLIIASHDKDLIRNMCTRVTQLEHCRVVESPA